MIEKLIIKIKHSIKVFQISPGIYLHHTVFSIRSADYLFQLTRTIFRMLRISDLKRSSRVGEADIYHSSMRAELPHWSSPFQLPTSHLQVTMC